MDSLKKIVNNIFMADVDDASRIRKNVDARRAYSKILRDTGLSYHRIAKTISKDHSTIVHYCLSADYLCENDSLFKKKLLLVESEFLLEKKSLDLGEQQSQVLKTVEAICCGFLEKMELGWMKLEDGTKCMPYIKGHSDEAMYRVNNCPSCGKYVREAMVAITDNE